MGPAGTILDERLANIAYNITEGDVWRGAVKAVAHQDIGFFIEKARPALEAYEEEAKALRAQREAALADVEVKRQALEAIASNMPLNGVAKDLVEKALGRAL